MVGSCAATAESARIEAIMIKSEIRGLLFLLLASVLAGILMTGFFLWHYDASTHYRLSEVLLEPTLLQGLNYKDAQKETSRYVFDHIELKRPGGQREPINLAHYGAFYQLLEGDQSILPTANEMDAFRQERLLSLLIYVRMASASEKRVGPKLFQLVEWVPEGDLYRVELHEQNPGGNWAYFRHPDVSQLAMETLLP